MVMVIIKDCSRKLEAWSATSFSSVHRNLLIVARHLYELFKNDPTHSNLVDINEAQKEVHKCLEKEEVMWQ